MGPMLPVILLTMGTVCHGAALFDQNRMKRDLKTDQTFNLYGVHVSLSYLDPTQPLKGGTINLKVDDLKKIFPKAQISKMDLRVKFQFKVKDRSFEIGVRYGFLHADGKWEEGTFDISRFNSGGDFWTYQIITECSKYSGKPIVPAAISNLEFKLESDIQNHFGVLYANRHPTINRYMSLSINRVSLNKINLKIANGQNPRTFDQLKDYKHDLNFIVDDFETVFRKIEMDGVFNVAVEGTSLGETVTGKFTGFQKDVQVIQFELEKGNKKIIQLDTKIQMQEEARSLKKFEARTKYALLGGKIAGKFLLLFNEGLLTLKWTDDGTKETLEMTVKVIPERRPGDYTSLELEGKKNGESMWTYKLGQNTQNFPARNFEMTLKTKTTLSSNSKVHKFLKEMYPYGAFNTRNSLVKIFVDRQNWNVLAPKFKIEVHLEKDGAKVVDLTADTTGSPYKFELFAPSVLGKLKPGMTEANISIIHNPGQSLEVKTNFEEFSGLKIYKTGSGNDRKVEMKGKDLILGDCTLTDNSFSAKVTLGDDYIEPKVTWEGKLPQTKREFETFMLENNIIVDVSGTKRNLDLSLNWKLMNPNLGTPQNAKISLNAKGNNPMWGDYSLSRDINWKIENRIVEVDWTGLAQFANGWLASPYPIETSFKFKVLLDENDLIGKFMKKIDGKEFSIDFPEGSGLMPTIIMGQ